MANLIMMNEFDPYTRKDHDNEKNLILSDYYQPSTVMVSSSSSKCLHIYG